MQAQAAFVRADGAVELHAIAAIDLHLTVVVDPRNAEHDDALGLDHTLEQSRLAVLLLVGIDDDAQRIENLGNSLDELGLLGILFLYALDDLVYIGHG